MLKCVSPLVVGEGKGKFSLNLNIYRNAHHYQLNSAKIRYKELMAPQIKALPEFDKVFLQFVLYPGSNRAMDLANVASVTEKFFCDALVEFGKIPDDNYKFVIGSTNTFGEVDKHNPRMEVLLYPVSPLNQIERNCTMKMTLGQNDLDIAIADYIHNRLGMPASHSVSAKINLSGRQRDIASAEVEVLPPGVAPAPVAEATPAPAAADAATIAAEAAAEAGVEEAGTTPASVF